MVSLLQRMRKLQTTLLAIRTGPGAAVLPKDVKRLHLRFATKIEDGHMGPRYAWDDSSITAEMLDDILTVRAGNFGDMS